MFVEGGIFFKENKLQISNMMLSGNSHMKHFMYTIICLYTFSAFSSDTAKLPIQAGITTYDNTTTTFFIESITDMSTHISLEIHVTEENMTCDTPFRRAYKQTWQISPEEASQLKFLNQTTKREELALKLIFLNKDSVKTYSEQLQDDVCTPW